MIPDVKVLEIWSDQLSGVKANYHPGGSGRGGGYGYLMISPISPTGHLKMRANLEIKPDISSVRNKVLVRVKTQDDDIRGASNLIDGTSIAEVWLSYGGYYGVQTGNIVTGIDWNDNQILDGEEKTDEYEGANFKLVNYTGYTSACTYLLGLATGGWGPFPHASNFLCAFLDSTAVPGASSVENTSLGVNLLYHNVGANFTGMGASATATIRENIFNSNHAIVAHILADAGFRNFLTNGFGEHTQQVQTYFQDHPDEQQKIFVWQINETVSYVGSHMVYTFGEASAVLTVAVRVKKNGLEVDDVLVTGYQGDRYDWDWEKGDLDIKGVRVQTGFSTLGIAGNVFESKVNFNNYITDLDYNFN